MTAQHNKATQDDSRRSSCMVCTCMERGAVMVRDTRQDLMTE
jgi:hypothetical protein